MPVLTFQKNLKCILLPPSGKNIELSPPPQIIVRLISQKILINNVLISIQCDACVKFSRKSDFCTIFPSFCLCAKVIEHTGYLHLPETAKHVDIPQEAEQQENRGPDPESAVNLPAEGSRESFHNIPKV